MITAQAHDIRALEKHINELNTKLEHLVAGPELKDVLVHIHKKYWTTPAEFRFANAIVESMVRNVDALAALKTEFAHAAAEVGHE